MLGVELTVMFVMIAVNGVFAAYEIGLASISLSRLQMLQGKGAAAAIRMKQGMERSLAVVQLGITLVGAIAAATGGAGAEGVINPLLRDLGLSHGLAEVLSIAAIVIPLTVLTIVFGELVPKLFALRHQEWICLRLSPLMSWFASATWPAVWLLETSAKSIMAWSSRWHPDRADGKSEAGELQELRAIAALARTARLIGAREERIIVGAARLSSRTVSEIMLPAEYISMLKLGEPMAASLVSAHLDMHTRFPVTARAGDPQAIVGYVNFKDIIAQLRISPQEPSLKSVLRPLPSLSAQSPISSALESLMRAHTHIALIREENGRVLGMITLEDIIEELVGEIQDEYDLLPMHVLASGHGWVVGGGVSLARLHGATGIDLRDDLPDSGARNISAWVIGHLGHPVQGGETLERPSVRLLVRKIRRQQVLEAYLTKVNPPADEPEER